MTDLLISIEQKKSPIEIIEGDAFISTAFVENLFLDGIPTKVIKTNTFRGLSYCKNLQLSNSFIEEIEPSAFYRTNNIEKINFKNSKLKFIDNDAFRGILNIKTLDLRGNYLRMVNRSSFEQLIVPKIKREKNFVVNETLRVFDFDNNNFIVESILLEQNPIQCDCNLKWILDNKLNQEYIKLPEICAGPRGYDCLRVRDLSNHNLNCDGSKQINEPPCQDLIFDINGNMDIHKISQNKNLEKKLSYPSKENIKLEKSESEDYLYDYDYSKNLENDNSASSKTLLLSTTSISWSKEKQTNEQKSFLKSLLDQSLGLSNCSNIFNFNLNCLIIFLLFFVSKIV